MTGDIRSFYLLAPQQQMPNLPRSQLFKGHIAFNLMQPHETNVASTFGKKSSGVMPFCRAFFQ